MTTVIAEAPRVIARNRIADLLAQPIMTSMRWATYEFALIGLSPILLDRMTNEQILGLVTGSKVDFPKDEPLETKAKRKMYSATYKNDMPDGALGFPRENLYATLRDAGMSVQYGSGKHDKITMSTKGTELFGMVRLQEEFYELVDKNGDPAKWVVDLRKGNATQGTGAVGIIRGRFNEWGVVGHIDLNVDSKLSEAKLRELFTVAGIKQGLCSARPSKKMPFGQFALTHLKWVAGAEPKKSVERIEEPKKPKRGRKGASEDASANGDDTVTGEGDTASSTNGDGHQSDE